MWNTKLVREILKLRFYPWFRHQRGSWSSLCFFS
jgi:hypothetical protein